MRRSARMGGMLGTGSKLNRLKCKDKKEKNCLQNRVGAGTALTYSTSM